MNKTSYINNYILKIVDSISAIVFPIITFSYVTRIIGPQNLGIIDFAQSYGYYFIHLASFGLNSYAIRELSKYRDEKEKRKKIGNELFNVNLIFSIISWTLYIIGVLFVPKFRSNFVIFFLYSMIVATDFLQIDWILQSFDDYFFSTIRSLIIRASVTILVFILIKNSSHYYIFMIIQTISEMGSRFFNVSYSNRTYFKIKIKPSFSLIKKYFNSLFTLFIFRLVNGITSNLDKLMIGFMLLYEDVSIYTIGVKLILILASLLEIIGIVLFPTINIYANKSQNEYQSLVNFNYKLITIIGIPLCVGFYILAPYIIPLFAGGLYDRSIEVARIMSIVIVLCPIGDLFGSKTLLVYNKDNQLLRISILAAISNIVLNLCLIPLYGINGAAIASVIGYIFTISLRFYYSKKIISIKLVDTDICKYTIFTIPFIIIYVLAKNIITKNIVYVILYTAICMIIYYAELLVSKDKTLLFIKSKKGIK